MCSRHCLHCTIDGTASGLGSVKESLDVHLPLREVGSEDAAIVGDETVDFTLDIGSLCPDAAAAGVHLDLLTELSQQDASAVVVCFEVFVDFVSGIDRVDCLLNVPKTMEC